MLSDDEFAHRLERPLPPRGGVCAGKPTIWWFPEIARDMKAGQRRVIHGHADFAKQLCGICPVVEECLSYSLEHEPFGIWGGLDESTRHQIRLREGITLSRTIGGLRPSRSNRPYTVGRPRNDDVSAHG